MEHLSNDHKDHELTTKIVISYTIKRGILLGHTVLSLTKSQWKLRQHDQSFPMEGNDCRTNTTSEE